MTPADERELQWWRDFALKTTPDSEMPRVGSPLIGHQYRVILITRRAS